MYSRYFGRTRRLSFILIEYSKQIHWFLPLACSYSAYSRCRPLAVVSQCQIINPKAANALGLPPLRVTRLLLPFHIILLFLPSFSSFLSSQASHRNIHVTQPKFTTNQHNDILFTPSKETNKTKTKTAKKTYSYKQGKLSLLQSSRCSLCPPRRGDWVTKEPIFVLAGQTSIL